MSASPPVTATPVTATPAPDAAVPTSHKRMYIVIGAVLVLIVIGIVLYFTVFKPKPANPSEAPAPRPSSALQPSSAPRPSSATDPTAPKYVSTGLVYYVDAGVTTSYSGSGNTWTDLSSSQLTTTLYGSPVFSSTNGGCFTFVPASSQYCQTTTALPTLTKWSVEVWYYYDKTQAPANGIPFIVTDMYTFGKPVNFSLVKSWQPVTDAGFSAGYDNTPADWNLTTPTQIPINAWSHIVGTFDGATLLFWLNGNKTASEAAAAVPISGAVGIRLMRDHWIDNTIVPATYLGGKLAVVRIYNRDLTAAEVSTNFIAGKTRFGLS